jgi:hypothetical protein
MENKGIKKRVFKDKNYKSVWFNGKTIRSQFDPKKPIEKLDYPEFYDVDIFETENGLCYAKCPWCYLSGNEDGKIVVDAVEKIKEFFGKMTQNQRPFQVALPGSGEFFEHGDWEEILEAFHNLGILPNYTTNGMWVNKGSKFYNRVVDATKKYCGGVAVSCHPHLRDTWEKASQAYYDNDIMLNFHIIISDKQSIDYFESIYKDWKGLASYFVLLPYGNQGRAKSKDIDWDYLVTKLPEKPKDIAFGANFHPYLLTSSIDVSLYEPEIMSGFLSLWDKGTLYDSSFSLDKVIKKDFLK